MGKFSASAYALFKKDGTIDVVNNGFSDIEVINLRGDAVKIPQGCRTTTDKEMLIFTLLQPMYTGEMSNCKLVKKENSSQFKNQCDKYDIKIKDTKVMRNSEIVKQLRDYIGRNAECHIKIYEDSCWWISLERHPYGQIRFWVGYSDKNTGRENSSLCTVYDHRNPISCAADFPLKKKVQEKIISTWKELHKNEIV